MRRFTIYIKDQGKAKDDHPDFLGTVEAEDVLRALMKVEGILNVMDINYEREDRDLANLSCQHLDNGFIRITTGNPELDIYVKGD